MVKNKESYELAGMGFRQRKCYLIKRRAVYYQNVNSFSPYNVLFSGFKSVINIRQMYFMNRPKSLQDFSRSTDRLNSSLII